MTAVKRWTRRPEGSNWGDFGPDDQLGRLNLITPQKVREGVAEVHEGLTFCLSLPLDYPGGNLLNPRRHPPVLRPTVRDGRPNLNYRLAVNDPNATDVVSDDAVILHTQYSTQWDSLAHVGQLFDADGDGVPERSTTTATARASTWWARAKRPARGRSTSCRPRRPAARARSASRTWPQAACRAAR